MLSTQLQDAQARLQASEQSRGLLVNSNRDLQLQLQALQQQQLQHIHEAQQQTQMQKTVDPVTDGSTTETTLSDEIKRRKQLEVSCLGDGSTTETTLSDEIKRRKQLEVSCLGDGSTTETTLSDEIKRRKQLEVSCLGVIPSRKLISMSFEQVFFTNVINYVWRWRCQFKTERVRHCLEMRLFIWQ